VSFRTLILIGFLVMGSLISTLVIPMSVSAHTRASIDITLSPEEQPQLYQTFPSADGLGSVASMIIQTFGPHANQALRIARCESGLNPYARNRYSGAAGVFQFLPSTWRSTPYARYSIYDAWANVQAARWLFVKSGYSWRAWSCR
jgi:hypothetical protein